MGVVVAAIIAVMVSMFLLLLRLFAGPSVFDRILAANNFGTNVVIIIALLGHAVGTVFFIDVALVYGLINFVTTIAFLRYFKYRG